MEETLIYLGGFPLVNNLLTTSQWGITQKDYN